MRRDSEAGQMMLLTAVVLVIGFVALGAMVTRVNDEAARTIRLQDMPAMGEADALATAIDELVIAMEDNYTAGTPTQAFFDRLNQSLDHLVALEKARGLGFSHSLVCTAPLTGAVEGKLRSQDARLVFLSRTFTDPTC